MITAKGSDVNFNSKVDLKKAYIRLKENESVKVRVLGLTDYVEYTAHSDFNNKVYTQPCVKPMGTPCPLCIASKSGLEQFTNLYGKKRYLFAFGDVESGEIRVWDCSKSQAKDLLSQIKEYAEDISETMFNFKRTGQKMETSYKLNPVLKLKGDDLEKFHMFDDTDVESEFFEAVLLPRTEKMMLDILDDAGFPMADFFPEYIRELAYGTGTSNVGDDEIPF